MEPRFFSHGYRFGAYDTVHMAYVSMEPRFFSHGYLCWGCSITGRSSGFNGATVFQPWIRYSTRAADGGMLPVSMEPRFFSHGYRPPLWRTSTATTGFNGATVFQPWIRYYETKIFSRRSYSAAMLRVNTQSSPSAYPGPGRDFGFTHGNVRALLLGHFITGALATVGARASQRPEDRNKIAAAAIAHPARNHAMTCSVRWWT